MILLDAVNQDKSIIANLLQKEGEHSLPFDSQYKP